MEDGGYSLVDVEAVDEKKFPSLFSAPWRQVSVSKGDCVFIPYGLVRYQKFLFVNHSSRKFFFFFLAKN